MGERESLIEARPLLVGDRVIYCDPYDRKEYSGKLVASPGAVFYGWTVQLDTGIYRGADSQGLRHEA